MHSGSYLSRTEFVMFLLCFVLPICGFMIVAAVAFLQS